MARNNFNIRRGRWCKFYYKSGFCKELFQANLGFRFSSSLRDVGFLFFWVKFDIQITSGNFWNKSEVYFLIAFFMWFSLKSNWIQIHMAFLFLRIWSHMFQNSSDPNVTHSITYFRSRRQEVFYIKKMFLKISLNSQEIPVPVSPFYTKGH